MVCISHCFFFNFNLNVSIEFFLKIHHKRKVFLKFIKIRTWFLINIIYLTRVLLWAKYFFIYKINVYVNFYHIFLYIKKFITGLMVLIQLSSVIYLYIIVFFIKSKVNKILK